MIIIKTPILPGRFDGYALLGCIVIVRRGCESLIPHELVHIKQQREVGIFKYHWKWLTSESFRAKVEIEAYRADGLDHFQIAEKLERLYNMQISPSSVWNIIEVENA